MERRGQSRWAGELWLLQVLSGLLLVVLLTLHMVANHFVLEEGLRTFADVVAYVSNPVIFVLEVVFLVTVTLHAMLGVRGILLDLGPGKSGERAVNWAVTLLGVAAVGYGIWLLLVIQAYG